MALIETRSGCKVGWEVYNDRAEAEARGRVAEVQMRDMEMRGYDFGYQVPGEVRQTADGNWIVTVP